MLYLLSNCRKSAKQSNSPLQEQNEVVQSFSLPELHAFKGHPFQVRDDDTAIIIMVDSNLQHDNILPSGRAQAYKMKLDAVKRQAGKPPQNAPNISANFCNDNEAGKQMGISGDTLRSYISIAELVPELQQMVDEKKIALSPAYQLAALKPEEQIMLL